MVVIDPRRTETAMAATEHLPVAPKGDLALLYLVARRLLELEAVDRDFVAAHTEGFDAFVSFLAELDEQDLLTRTGLPRERIDGLAETIATGERVAFFWTMGVNQSFEGVRVAQAIINICLMTGNIGRPGTGPCSLTGQANAMGSRIFSNTTNLLGGRDFQNPDHRAHVAAELGIPVGRIPAQPSDAYDQILESVLSGRTKALWYIATNPAHSWISQPDFRDVLGRLDLLVVQDMYTTTETAELADIVLPAAGWGEKEGTFINSERRIQRIRKLRKAPGEALADFHIFQLLAEYWGVGDLFREWSSPEAVFDILRRLSGGQPCDFTGIDGYRQLEEAGGIQWPLRPGEKLESHERRLFED
ncbi:MAG: molybdopterin-dependent oxidoreductase, partial [Myxococcota bacterium]